MPIMRVHHQTVYRYAEPVHFGEHRLMLRPRDSHDLRVMDLALVIEPAPTLRWMHDVFGNSIALASFERPARELVFDSSFRAEQVALTQPAAAVEPHAQRYPFNYSAEERMDLGYTLMRHRPDPWGRVDTWARWFVDADRSLDTLEILAAITRSIQYQFVYASRDEMGTQDPIETLTTRSGNCRDFALFMMEAVRSLGLAARFVSGYLYGGSSAGPHSTLQGSGATHAWVQVYLPGAGWLEFDPTNALIGGQNLIRVAVARDPSQALPVSGTFIGAPGAFLGMSVSVTVTSE
jgi:transglutaminase-like putative cysteine protease